MKDLNEPTDLDFERYNAGLKLRAVKSFRRGHQLRRFRRGCGMAFGLAAACLLVLEVSKRNQHTHPATVQSRLTTSTVVQQPNRAAAAELTDEQLLALFPPGSCWMAEIDGRKTLIFADPRLEKEYVDN